MAFFGGSWNDDRDEWPEDIGPLSHWLEDYDLDYIKDPDEDEWNNWE